MIPWILNGTLFIAVIALVIKQSKRTTIDRTEAKSFELEVERLQMQRDDLQKDIRAQINTIEEYQNKILEIQKKYRQELSKKSNDLDAYFTTQKSIRQLEMDNDFERLLREKEENLKIKYNELERTELEKEHKFKQEVQNIVDAALKNQQSIVSETELQQQRFESLLEPLKQYEKEKQDRLFYTIQVPDEYKGDIDFLLSGVAKKIQHPDIINKLIWAEYVRPYLDQTFKRIGVEDKPGIYKLTSLNDGKCYIGKSVNIKKRLSDHFKAAIGINSIANQSVHHEILRTGYWNWTIEIILYCDKDKLNELEKYYIDFFKSNEWGFNKTKGGEG